MSELEVDAAAIIFDLRRQAAYGVNKHNISSLSQSLVQSEGEDMMRQATTVQEIKRAQCLIDAKCTNQWIDESFGERVQDTVVEEGRTKSFVKKNLSTQKTTSMTTTCLMK